MSDERPARRYPASAFPEIRGLRLTPPGAAATLVNVSATGMLVECAARVRTDSAVAADVDGAFVPGTLEGRVVRCEVAGIAADGTLRYHLAVAFKDRITLAPDLDSAAGDAERPPGVPPEAVLMQAADAPESLPVLRNRW